MEAQYESIGLGLRGVTGVSSGPKTGEVEKGCPRLGIQAEKEGDEFLFPSISMNREGHLLY